MAEAIRIAPSVIETMLAEARASASHECCGLLAGLETTITHVFPARNALNSPTSYEIAPNDLFRLFCDMRDAGLEHLGIYHSHPRGENSPSARDIELAFYPCAAYVIISPLAGAPRPVRAFHIRDSQVTELAIKLALI